MSISCSENRRREVSLFCVQTVGYLLETSFENFSLFEMYHFVQMWQPVEEVCTTGKASWWMRKEHLNCRAREQQQEGSMT